MVSLPVVAKWVFSCHFWVWWHISGWVWPGSQQSHVWQESSLFCNQGTLNSLTFDGPLLAGLVFSTNQRLLWGTWALKAVQALLFRLALLGTVFLLLSLGFTALSGRVSPRKHCDTALFYGWVRVLQVFADFVEIQQTSSLWEQAAGGVCMGLSWRSLPCGGWRGMCVCVGRGGRALRELWFAIAGAL